MIYSLKYRLIFKSNLFFIFFYTLLITTVVYTKAHTSNLSTQPNNLTYSFFTETGETESSFTIGGRNFPVRVGAVGLKATYNPNINITFYSKAGLGYSQKQSVSAFNFNVSGSVFATSIGAGTYGKFRIRKSDFVIVPFVDLNIYNYFVEDHLNYLSNL